MICAQSLTAPRDLLAQAAAFTSPWATKKHGFQRPKMEKVRGLKR